MRRYYTSLARVPEDVTIKTETGCIASELLNQAFIRLQGFFYSARWRNALNIYLGNLTFSPVVKVHQSSTDGVVKETSICSGGGGVSPCRARFHPSKFVSNRVPYFPYFPSFFTTIPWQLGRNEEEAMISIWAHEIKLNVSIFHHSITRRTFAITHTTTCCVAFVVSPLASPFSGTYNYLPD